MSRPTFNLNGEFPGLALNAITREGARMCEGLMCPFDVYGNPTWSMEIGAMVRRRYRSGCFADIQQEDVYMSYQHDCETNRGNQPPLATLRAESLSLSLAEKSDSAPAAIMFEFRLPSSPRGEEIWSGLNPDVEGKPPRIRFTSFGAYSLESEHGEKVFADDNQKWITEDITKAILIEGAVLSRNPVFDHGYARFADTQDPEGNPFERIRELEEALEAASEERDMLLAAIMLEENR